MTLTDLRIASKKTFQEIANELKMNDTTVFRIIHTPWRTSCESYIKIATHLGMAEDKAREEWLESKMKHIQEKANNKIKKLAGEIE